MTFVARSALAAALFTMVGCRETPTGVSIDIQIDAEEFRPTFIQLHWLRPGQQPFALRLPESGVLPVTPSPSVANVFFGTIGPPQEPRALVARGFRGDREVSGGTLRIEGSNGGDRDAVLVLRGPLPDVDRNGVPDAVDRVCLTDPTPINCPDIDGKRGDGGAGQDADAPPTDTGANDVGPADAPANDGQSPGPSNEGLVGHWLFDDEASSRAVIDSSGRNNHGALRGSQTRLTAGRSGGALEVPSANNQGVLVPASGSLDSIQSAFTIAAWVHRSATRPAVSQILSRRSSGTAKHFALALSPDGSLRLYINSQASLPETPVIAPIVVPDGTWVHVAGTYDGKDVRLFVSGRETKNVAIATSIRATGTLLCLGCGQTGDIAIGEPIGGRLDDLRLYARALSPEEIALLAR